MKKDHNFIIFWLSQSISQLGSALTSFALIIWIYTKTDSALAVSLLTFCSYLPYIFGSLFSGSLVDKYPKKVLLLISDGVAFLGTLMIVILLRNNNLQLWHLYLVNSLTGLMNAIQAPASSIAIRMMVKPDQLSKASGMNSLSSSLQSVITPLLAASLCSFIGLEGIITIDILTFGFAFTVLLFFIQIPEKKSNERKKNKLFTGFKEGLTYLRSNKGLWYLIISLALMNFFSRLTYENILPAMILARSNNDQTGLGIVSGIMGLGGIIGSLYVSFFKLPKNPTKVIYLLAALSFLLGDLTMGMGRNVYWWGLAGLAASIPIPLINAGSHLLIYQKVKPEIQGRVLAVRNAIQYSTIPLGILLGGVLAEYIYEPFVASNDFFALLVGTGSGSGMALMFLGTGIAGTIVSIIGYLKPETRKLSEHP